MAVGLVLGEVRMEMEMIKISKDSKRIVLELVNSRGINREIKMI